MASRLVKLVKDLIAGNSASKKSNAPAPQNTRTVSVHEMLFGSPKKTALNAPVLDASTVAVSSGHREDEKLPISVIPPTEEVVIKQEPLDELDCPGDNEAYGDGMGCAKANSGEVINADEFSFASQEVLLVYPFLGADNVEKASFGLPLCDTGDDVTCSQVITNQLEKIIGRNHIQTITQVDRDSLHPKSYVNDVIIDFWMLWLLCNSLRNESCESFFTSQFYTKLIETKGGLNHVSGWVTCRKDFNIFEKSIIYFPIVLEKHWSLFVAFSPAKVLELNSSGTSSGTKEVPVLMHLDSIQLHKSAVIAENIRMFFSYVWQIINPGSDFKFAKSNYPVICPEDMSFFYLFSLQY
jgi:hypothetical protein